MESNKYAVLSEYLDENTVDFNINQTLRDVAVPNMASDIGEIHYEDGNLLILYIKNVNSESTLQTRVERFIPTQNFFLEKMQPVSKVSVFAKKGLPY